MSIQPLLQLEQHLRKSRCGINHSLLSSAANDTNKSPAAARVTLRWPRPT
jgi:hypothetical protein